METFLPALIAAAAIFIVWKLLKGAVKTIALLAILAAAAFYMFGGEF